MIDIIANRYAEALFQLSEDENITKEIYNELCNVVDTVKNNKDLDNVLKSPLVAKIEKVQLIEALFNNKINNNLKNFLKILVEKGRISSLKSIELTFKQLLNDKNNIIEGTVISAIPLTDKKVKELEEKLSKKYNKNVTLENKVDQSILGGVLVRLGNTQIDGSVKTRLDNIKDQLSQVIS
ncbi:F0F1 ATP synthase subunit delta [Terrisporobacter mayombei]|uniref:ATP synthase subunit delta n=1 Tax=Terrisporobacter mayombei TaxID=1541 RepID=A0ABY9Q5A8_9FIRM|nr:F0F1 ATP synthase subunit delta [Terrisporobacter mayombei]MCC3869156.1 F0F1 ATP synthase subunit delta [Terrisporobacter mayombei]WMT82708.1 ATP synthase subunit delta, sodium ion specific [Terrisporobacter mayombei]